MEQQSYIYVNGSVAVLSLKLLPEERIARLADSKNFDEAMKVLYEAGYADGSPLADSREFEQLLEGEMKKVAKFVKENSAEPTSTDCFLIFADYQNAKTIMKSKYLRKAVQFLSEMGLIPPSEMETQILADDYTLLPVQMSEALKKIDDEFFQGNRKPTVIDVELDKACYSHVMHMLKKSKSAVVKEYFKAEIDFKNILNFYRTKKANIENDYFLNLFLENGSFDKNFFVELNLFSAEKQKETFKNTQYFQFVGVVFDELEKGKALSASETYCLNFKKNILKPLKNNFEGIEPLIYYYLAKKTEIENIRLILVCLKNGVDKQQAVQRLREQL